MENMDAKGVYHPNHCISKRYVNETSQISERYSVQMKAAMKQKRLFDVRSDVPLDD